MVIDYKIIQGTIISLYLRDYYKWKNPEIICTLNEQGLEFKIILALSEFFPNLLKHIPRYDSEWLKQH